MAKTIEQALSEHETDEDAPPRSLLPARRKREAAIVEPPGIVEEQAGAAQGTLQARLVGGTALWTNHRYESVTWSASRHVARCSRPSTWIPASAVWSPKL